MNESHSAKDIRNIPFFHRRLSSKLISMLSKNVRYQLHPALLKITINRGYSSIILNKINEFWLTSNAITASTRFVRLQFNVICVTFFLCSVSHTVQTPTIYSHLEQKNRDYWEHIKWKHSHRTCWCGSLNSIVQHGKDRNEQSISIHSDQSRTYQCFSN